MSSQQTGSDKPRSFKCHNYCFSFDLHNYFSTCRESGKGDDPCVTNRSAYKICSSFTDEQINKIRNRNRYVSKQKTVAET